MNPDSVIEMRIRGAQEAASRARLAFLVTIVACGTIMIALYNSYFAWNRMLVDPKRGLAHPIMTRPCLASDFVEPAMPEKLSPQQASEWAEAMKIKRTRMCETVGDLQKESDKEDVKHVSDSNSISLPWLGISLGSADLDIFGSFGLYIACGYYLLCMRRLNRDVRTLLMESAEAELSVRRYVYFGIRQALVLSGDADDANPDGGSRVVRGLQTSFSLLKFLPITVIGCMLAADWWYLHTISYQGGWAAWWQNLQADFKVQFVLGSAAALIVGFVVFLLNQKARSYEYEITNAMKNFAEGMEMSELREKPVP
jgi:hypothetical protein